MASEAKKHTRQQLRQARQALTPEQQDAAARQLLEQFIKTDLRHYNHFALYLADDGEIDTKYLTKWLWAQNKKTYLPCIEAPSAPLTFRQYHEDTPLKKNKFNLFEPENSVSQQPFDQLDVIMVPLVAFDRNGHRLGRGGGYYDRTLSQSDHPMSIGIAHNFQQVEQIPVDSWDIHLDAIMTNFTLIRTNKSQHI